MFVWTDLTWIDHAQWHNFMKISYPYGGTINFKICLDVQLTTHQPPMPNSSQTSAWSHRYIGRGSGKTEIPLLDSERISKDWMAEKTIGKSSRFRTSGSTFWSQTTRSRFGSYSYRFFEGWKAENSLSKSGRFRTSGSTFWSRRTRGRFDSDLTVSRTTCELTFCIRVRERSRFFKYWKNVTDTPRWIHARKRAGYTHHANSDIQKLWYVYENGADSSDV